MREEALFLRACLACVFVALGACSSGGGDDDGNNNQPANLAPICDIQASPTIGVAPLTVSLDASGSFDSDGQIVQYLWDFGDGASSSGSQIDHVFSADGSYTVRLTVTDDGGKTDTGTITVLVDSSGQIVGSAGGTVSSGDGLVSLIIPAGALSTTVAIDFEPVPTDFPSGAVGGSVYALSPDGLVFDQPVTLTLGYDPAALPAGFDPADLWIGRLISGATDTWQRVGTPTVDAGAQTVSVALTGFSTYGVMGGGIFDRIDRTVYVVEPANANGVDRFSELEPALAALNAVLTPWQSGEIVLQTSRSLAVTRLSLLGNIRFRVEPGFSPALSGPAGGVLAIDAPGALGLSGFSIGQSSAVAVQSGADLVFTDNTLPALVVQSGAAAATASATRVLPQANGGAMGGSLFDVSRNLATGPIQWSVNSDLNGWLTASDNQSSRLSLAGTGRAAGQLSVSRNLVDQLGITLNLGASAQMKVDNHANLDDLVMNLDLLSNAAVRVETNHAARASLDFNGTELGFIALSHNTLKGLQWRMGTSGTLQVDGEQNEYTGEMAVTLLTGELFWSENGFNAAGAVRMTTEAGSRFDFSMLGNITAAGQFDLIARGDLLWRIAADAYFGGFTTLTASGALADVQIASIRTNAGLTLDMAGVTASVFVGIGNGIDRSSVLGLVDYVVPNAAAGMFQVSGAEVTAGINVALPLDFLQVGTSLPASPAQRLPAAAASQGVTIRDVSISSDTAGILVSDISSGQVLVEDCQITGPGGIGINSVSVPATVRNNTLQGNGVMVFDNGGTVTVEGNTIQATSGAGVTVAQTASVQVNSNQITATGPGPALAAVSETRVSANGNTITGMVLVGFDGILDLIDNTFAGSFIIDGNIGGGLVSDPVNDNDGMAPGNVQSLVDWDGNGCADYPPENNIKDDQGECVLDGVPPPG